MNNIVREKFVENFNMSMVATDLMDLIEEIDMTGDVLKDYIYNEFGENFMYGELYDLFKNYMSKEDLKQLLEDMGHDFVDLDELEDDEKDKYF